MRCCRAWTPVRLRNRVSTDFQSSLRLDSPLLVDDHKAFSVRLLSQAAEFSEELDVTEIYVEVINLLPSVGDANVLHRSS